METRQLTSGRWLRASTTRPRSVTGALELAEVTVGAGTGRGVGVAGVCVPKGSAKSSEREGAGAGSVEESLLQLESVAAMGKSSRTQVAARGLAFLD